MVTLRNIHDLSTAVHLGYQPKIQSYLRYYSNAPIYYQFYRYTMNIYNVEAKLYTFLTYFIIV